jgi:hypothetical protein
MPTYVVNLKIESALPFDYFRLHQDLRKEAALVFYNSNNDFSYEHESTEFRCSAENLMAIKNLVVSAAKKTGKICSLSILKE